MFVLFLLRLEESLQVTGVFGCHAGSGIVLTAQGPTFSPSSCVSRAIRYDPRMPPQPLVPPENWNPGQPLFDKEAVRETIAQRFEMEQLDGVSYMDADSGQIVGWKDVRDDEFWIRGHIPGRPLMPGVLMLEALAQLTSFYVLRGDPRHGFVGFGAVDEVKFRRTVVPGERLILLARAIQVRPRRAIFDTQGWVGDKLAVHAKITGVRV